MAPDPLSVLPHLRLDQLATVGIAEVGGKAYHLGRLVAAGLPVPDAFVVPAETFRAALERAGLMPLALAVERDTGQAPALAAAIGTLQLPPAVRDEWVHAARALETRLVVRSSGAEEDGAHRSFAGAHTTWVDVAPADVPQAVLACWASLYGKRAIAYRHGGGPRAGSLAVIVQRLVVPETSGVLFTVNPRTGNWSEMVVEAVWGLGEGIASGALAPHSYVVRRPRAWPGPLSRLAARVSLQVVREDLPELPEQFVTGPEGPRRVPTADGLRRLRTLDDHAVRVLCRLGLKVESAFGEPVDVEWVRDRSGRFYVVQARPITVHTGTRRGEVLWTRRFLGERWTEPATPLGWSLLAPVLDWLIAYPDTQERLLGGGPALKLVHGRPYVNATVFRHLAFKLPGAPPPSFMLELVPPDEEQGWRRRFAVAPDLEVYASLLRTSFGERRWERFGWNPFTNPDQWANFEQRLEAALPRLSARTAGVLEAIARVEEHMEWIREYVGIHACSLLFANICYQLLQHSLETWLPERCGPLMDALAVCPAGNLTLETNAALHGLAAVATDTDLDALERGEGTSEPFASALRAFLDRFGHRSEASWELMSVRWGRYPSRLAPLLRAQRHATPNGTPAERARGLTSRYDAAMAELGASLGPVRLASARTLVRYTRRYLLLRENQRFWFERLTNALQETLFDLGRVAVDRGALDAVQDVAFLTWDELQDVVTRGTDLRDTVVARQMRFAADRAVDPPVFLVGDDPGPPEGPAKRLDGLGISAGRVRGRVRVVRTLQDGDQLLAGEILVARALDPAWTPLFAVASGVVLELGGLLSHGAVVAREYGLPSVVNVERATERLVDGTEVTVDGSRGVVWVHGTETVDTRPGGR